MPTQFVETTVAAATSGHEALTHLVEVLVALLPPGCFIVGECLADALLGKEVTDISIWSSDAEAYAALKLALESSSSSGALMSYSFVEKTSQAGAISFTVDATALGPTPVPPLFIRLRAVGKTEEEVLNMMDFTVCQVLLSGGGRLVVGPTTLDDLRAGRLVLVQSKGMLLNRTRVFINDGFLPTEQCWLDLIAADAAHTAQYQEMQAQ
jgi:hypothetical protein